MVLGRWVGQVLGLLWMVLGATPALGQGLADEADTHFRMGAEAYQRGDLNEALLRFMQSNRLSPNVSAAGNVGHTYTAMRRYPEAYRWYAYAVSLTDDEDSPILRAMREIEDRVVLIDVTSDPPGATVYVDRKNLGSVGTTPVTLALTPGRYNVIVELEGYRDFISDAIELPRLGNRTPLDADLEPIVGTVRITGDAGATVHMGQESSPSLCTVPCETQLPVGQQLLFFKREGYRSQPSLVNVEDSRTAEVRADLIVVTGSVRVEADELGALVEIDGVVRGFTPVVVNGVRTGRNTLRVTKRGFEPFETVIDIPEDELLDVGRIVLEPLGLVSSASRYEEDLFTAPASISVVTAAEIEAFGYPSLAEALRGVRGVVHTDNSGQLTPAVRGIGAPAGNRTKTTLDGLNITDPVLGATSHTEIRLHYLDHVDRIEITRGSGSVLYGAGAMNALVAIERRDRTYGNSGEAHIGVIGSQAIGRGYLSLGNPELGGYAGLAVQRDRGREVVFEDFAIPQYDPVTGAPLLAPDGQGQTAIGDYTVERYLPFSSVQFYGKTWVKDLEFRWHVAPFFDGQLNQGLQQSDPNAGDSPLKGSATFLDLLYLPQLSDNARLQLRLAYGNLNTDVQLVSFTGTTVLDNISEARWITGEARGFFDLTPRIKLLTGLELLRSIDSSATQSLVSPLGLFEVFGLDESDTAPILVEDPFILSAYALADARPSDRLRLNAGVRADRWDSIQPDNAGTTIQPVQNNVLLSPRLVAIWTPTDTDAFKFMGYQGNRQPDIFERGSSNGVTQVAPDVQLEAETVRGGELEWQGRFARDWTALASVWGNRYTNLVLEVPSGREGPTGELITRANVGQTDTYGADWELQRRLKRGWLVNLWYSYQRSFTTQPDPCCEQGTRVFETADQPRHLGAFKVLAPASQNVRVATKVTLDGGRATESGERTKPSVYADLVASGTLVSGRFFWRAGVYNAFDASSQITAFPDAPRRFMASVTFRGPASIDLTSSTPSRNPR